MNAVNVCILGVDVIDQLYDKQIPIGSEIVVSGIKLKVIGALEKKGNMMGGGDDRVIIVPLETGRKMAVGRSLNFDITTSSSKIINIEDFIQEIATIRTIDSIELLFEFTKKCRIAFGSLLETRRSFFYRTIGKFWFTQSSRIRLETPCGL